MSIARAFTTRRVKQSLQLGEIETSPSQRSNTKGLSSASIRHKISAPVQLVHSTNILSYNAPDLYPKATSPSSSSSGRSDDDSMSDSAGTTASSPPTSPDVESVAKRSMSPDPKHLSTFFTVPSQQTSPVATEPEKPVAPPQRSSSRTHGSQNSTSQVQAAGRQRSASSSRMSEQSQRTVSSKASLTFSRTSASSTSTTATSVSATSPIQHRSKNSGVSATVPASFASSPSQRRAQRQAIPPPQQPRKEYSQSAHPFGQELAQVSEIAEEYGVKERLAAADPEEQEMASRGLLKFAAEDYLSEIRDLVGGLFTEPMSFTSSPVSVSASSWI